MAHRGKNRLFLIFTPSPTHGPYARQRHLLQDHEAACADRDLLTIDFVEDTPAADAARSRFGVGRETFTAVLVGKDGGEKFRSTEPVRPQDLFDRIDAMPLRRREMRG